VDSVEGTEDAPGTPPTEFPAAAAAAAAVDEDDGHLPDSDDSPPGSTGHVRLRSDTTSLAAAAAAADTTTPKCVYEPLTLELRSSPVQAVSDESNNYIRILDVDPLSSMHDGGKDVSLVSLCCRDDADVSVVVCAESAERATQ